MSDEARVTQTVEPVLAEAPPEAPIMRSPLHHRHVGLGARFIREAGWEVPAAYGAAPELDREAIRDGLAVADITARGKLDLRGSLDDLIPRMAQPSDVVVARLGTHWALLLTPPAAIAAWLVTAEGLAGASAMATDATSIYAGFAVCGPRADDLLARLTPFDLSRLQVGMAAAFQLARISAIVVRRAMATEVYVGSEYGRYGWDTLLAAGRSLGIRPVGWDALRAEGWR